MASDPSSRLKTAKSIDAIDLASSASSGLPVPDAGLKQTQSVDAVNKSGRRRTTIGFEDNWLAHLTSLSNNVMEFSTDDEPDNWSQASYESSVASTAELGHRGRPLSGSVLSSRRHSTGDKLDLQSTSRRGLSNSMILTWLSHKRYAPVNEPISEVADVAGSGDDEPSSAVAGVIGLSAAAGMSAPSAAPLKGTPIIGTGLTAAANAIVAGNDPSKLGMDAKKKMKVNYRELNAVAPSFW